jgi:hypothetical protein
VNTQQPRQRRSTALATALALAACSTAPPMPDPPRTHPASPHADEAPERAPSDSLTMPVRTPRGDATGSKKGH